MVGTVLITYNTFHISGQTGQVSGSRDGPVVGGEQWWERSPPTNVVLVHFWLGATGGWVCCWFLPCTKVFLRVLWFFYVFSGFSEWVTGLTGPWLNLYWKDSNLSFFYKNLIVTACSISFSFFPRVNIDAYNSLVEMGFSKHMAAASLRQANNDINDALQVNNCDYHALNSLSLVWLPESVLWIFEISTCDVI